MSAGQWQPGEIRDLLLERARFLDVKNAAAWDKILVPLVGLGGALIPVTVGWRRALEV
ncbi:MAG: hypothetical protein AB9891_04520 [Anaerolineaceae bacterium]